jgi:preprotein translocase subunit SecE
MKLADYIKDTRGELKHVNWPSRQQAIAYTVIVILASLVVSGFLGFFDYLFSFILQKLIS